MDKNSTFFDQNIEGVAYRTKFRFRWYDGGYISLEEKIKKAGVGYKRRDLTNFTKIENLDFSSFDKIKNFKPIVMNRYFREYFINSEGERITLDSMIKFKAYNSLKTVNSEVNILEIKSSTEHPLLADLNSSDRFYFLHSYVFECEDQNMVLASSEYGREFTSLIINRNIFGMQCHPEKSHLAGMRFLKNFATVVTHAFA